MLDMGNKLLNDLLPIAQRKSLNVIFDCGQEVAYADPLIVERILKNLLENAIKYTSEGQVKLVVVEQECGLRVSVEDSGLGIDASEQENIFTEFHQINNPERNLEKGLGLGLAIVKRLCDLQGCPLTLSSTLGQGSIFEFTLPIGMKGKVAPNVSINEIIHMPDIRILIIEDNRIVSDSLASLLELWEIEVKTCEDIEGACEKVDCEQGWVPDLIIADYRLGKNATGVQAIRTIQSKYKSDIKGLLITGDTAPERINELELSGFDVMHKPVKPARLKAYIRQSFK